MALVKVNVPVPQYVVEDHATSIGLETALNAAVAAKRSLVGIIPFGTEDVWLITVGQQMEEQEIEVPDVITDLDRVNQDAE